MTLKLSHEIANFILVKDVFNRLSDQMNALPIHTQIPRIFSYLFNIENMRGIKRKIIEIEDDNTYTLPADIESILLIKLHGTFTKKYTRITCTYSVIYTYDTIVAPIQCVDTEFFFPVNISVFPDTQSLKIEGCQASSLVVYGNVKTELNIKYNLLLL